MSISVEPDLFGNITLGASCTGCAGILNVPSPDEEAYGSSPDLSGPVEVDFIYNSNSPENGPFGYGRTLTTNFYLKVEGDTATVTRGNGSQAKYVRDAQPVAASGSGVPLPSGSGVSSPSGVRYNPQKVGSRNQLMRFDDGTWIETAPDGRKMVFTGVVEGQLNRMSYAEDSVGNRHTFSYSGGAKNLLTGITDAYGRPTTFNYNPDQTLLMSVTDFAGRPTSFEYDTAAIPGKPLLTKITGPTNCVTKYEYQGTAMLTAVTDPNGYRTNYTYDAQRRVTSRTVAGVGTDFYSYGADGTITNPLGEKMKFETDANGKVVAGVNDKNQRRTITRDANGWETARQDMTGATTYTEYNSRGDVTKLTDAIGHRTYYERDAYGNATKITYDDGSFELMDWGAGAVAARRRLLKHTDELGKETTYTYDSHGKMTSVTDALSATTTMGYDNFGRLIRTTDALGAAAMPPYSTTFEYDAADNMTARVDGMNHRWSYEYDLADRLTKSTDAENGVMQFGYDANGNVNLVRDELQYLTTTKYNAFDLPYEQTDALNNVTRWEYDKRGRQTAQIVTVNGVEQRTSIEINNLGQVSATIDALGRRTETEFDANNRAVATKNALNGRISRGYNGAGWLTTVVDAIGRRTEFSYDKRGRLTTTTQIVPSGDNVVTSTQYDLKGQPVAAVDALGKSTITAYDAVGRVISVTDANSNSTQMEYDDIGQLIAVTDAEGVRTQMEYDKAGRHIATVEAVGTLNYRTTMTYDNVGRQLTMIDANNVTTRMEYDAKGQQKVSVDGRGNRTVVEYDKLGRQTAIVDAGGALHRTEMTYDAVGQLLSRRDALNNVESFTYDKAGNQISRKDGRNQTTTYVYDKLNRLTSQQLTGETAITFTYDAMGQQLSMTDQSGTTTNTYDVLGRLTSESNGRGNKLSYEYDKAGRRTALVDPENGRTTYVYADNGWLLRLTNPQNGATVYSYDKVGRELTKTLPNGVKTTHVYNALGYETSLQERDINNTLLNSYASTYNNVGMKKTVTEKDGSVVTYGYYLNYGLASEERTGTSPYKILYFYDAAGNVLRTELNGAKTTTNTDAANQITSKVGPNGTVNFTYDADGNLSSEVAADGSGKSYIFDSRDQLVVVEMKSAGGALSHRSEFTYDGVGRLTKSAEFTRSGTTWVKASETNRVCDGLDTVQQRDGNNALLTQLTRDGNIGGVLSRKVGANTSFFGYDGNGNVALLSDAQGNSVGRYRYDGFGNALEVSGSSAIENEHRFSTKELHAPSGLYYYGFRFYSPTLGRWINRDPIREVGGVNLYQMTGNNPINFVDLRGLAERPKSWGPDKIAIVFNAFIPTYTANAPGLNNGITGSFKGDNRGFDSNDNSYRTMHTVVMNRKTGQATAWEDVGQSVLIEGGFGLSDDRKKKAKNRKSLHTYVSGDNCRGWDILIEGNGKDAWTPEWVTAGITYDVRLHVSPSGIVTMGDYSFDKYPAYEIWEYRNAFSATLIYGQMPHPTRNNVGNLIPGTGRVTSKGKSGPRGNSGFRGGSGSGKGFMGGGISSW